MKLGEAGTATRFAQDAVNELQAPKTLTERNWVQLMLAERVSAHYGTTVLEAMQVVSPLYRERFPLRVS